MNNSRKKKPDIISEDLIRKKAYELWLHRRDDAEANWYEARTILEKEITTSKKPLKHITFLLNQPLIGLEKRIVEPLADWFDRSDIFRIFERLSPLIEAVGVILIPVFILWATQIDQNEKDRQEQRFREQEQARLQQESIRDYFNQLTTVLLEDNLRRNKDLQTIATATTLTLLQDPSLDGLGKGRVVVFLVRMDLLQPANPSQEDEVSHPIISLEGANLDAAYLRRVNLQSADLRSSFLRGANLNSAYLRDADLSGADLEGADLSGADLSGADLLNVNLENSNLHNANLCGVKNLTPEQVRAAQNWTTADCL